MMPTVGIGIPVYRPSHISKYAPQILKGISKNRFFRNKTRLKRLLSRCYSQ